MYPKKLRRGAMLLMLLALASCVNQPSESPKVIEPADLPPTGATTPPTPMPAPTSTKEQIPVALASPTPKPEPTATEESMTSRLTVCMVEPPVPLNPYTSPATSQTVMSSLNDGPVDYIRFSYRPTLLAEYPAVDSGNVSLHETDVQDGDTIYNEQTGQVETYRGSDTAMEQMRVRFIIRPDVEWSDGSPLSAYDSFYAYQLLLESSPETINDPGSPASQLLSQTASYQVLDEYTTEWSGIPGMVTPDYLKFFFPPMPQHLNITLETKLPEVGWGAFQLLEWTPGKSLLVTRNLSYYRANEGLPKVEEVEFLFFEPPYKGLPPRISQANCHVIGQSLVYALTMEEWLETIQGTEWQLVTGPSPTGLQLVFNIGSESQTSDRNVRQAIASCIDRSALAELVYGTVADSFLHPLDPAMVSLAFPTYDPQEGIELLSDMEQQQNLTLRLAIRDSMDRMVIESLVADLNECGFAIQPDYLGVEDFYKPWPDGPVFGGQYDMVLFPLSAADRSGCEWFSSENLPSEEKPQGPNISGWQNETFDEICVRAHSSLDTDEHLRLEREAQLIWEDTIPSLPLLWYPKYAVLNCHVIGYQLDPLATELWNIEKISLAQTCGP